MSLLHLSKLSDLSGIVHNIVIRGACINGEHHWVVYFYDNSGNEMERKRFTDWADAGEYAMKLETFWKYNRG
jgi:hypothetical protein